MEDFVKKADGLHRPFFVLPVIAASEKFIYGKAASHRRAGAISYGIAHRLPSGSLLIFVRPTA